MRIFTERCSDSFFAQLLRHHQSEIFLNKLERGDYLTDMNLSHTLGRLRLTGILEGISFIVLLAIAMPLKYMAGKPEMVSIVGMAHGVLFVLYIILTVVAKIQYPWSWKKMFLLWGASVLPFGTLYADYKVLRYDSRAGENQNR